jgi:alkylhydroperoxidase family enzyme
MARSRAVRLRADLALALVLALAGVAAQAPASPRLDPVPESRWTDAIRDVAHEAPLGGMPNLVAAYANNPVAAAALLPHLKYIWGESALPPRDRVLLSLRTLWLTQSEYLWAHRVQMAMATEGFSRADIERIARGPKAHGWNRFEATLLSAADELIVDAFISDATWHALDQRYDLPELVDTIDTVGALTMNAGIVNSLGVTIESGMDERLPRDIPVFAEAERTNIRLVGGTPRIPPEIPEDASFAANVFYTFRHNPVADRVRGAINTHVTGRATIDPLYREFLLVRIGTLCRSEYEYAAHVRVGRGAGMTDEDLDWILAGPDGGSGDPIKYALLSAADELFEDYTVHDDTWRELAKTQSPEQLIDILVAVGGYRSTSMLINSAGVQLDANMADFRFPEELR